MSTFIIIRPRSRPPRLPFAVHPNPKRAAANGGFGHHGNTTGFVVSVRGHWFLITAGHVLEDIEKAQETEQQLMEWHLDDTGAEGAKSNIPIPFEFEYAFKLWFFDGSGADYALIHLRPHYRSLLKANNIVASDENAWKKNVPTEFDKYVLLGVPAEFVMGGIVAVRKKAPRRTAVPVIGKAVLPDIQVTVAFSRHTELCAESGCRAGSLTKSRETRNSEAPGNHHL